MREGNRVSKKPSATLHIVSGNKILCNVMEKWATEIIFMCSVYLKKMCSILVVAFTYNSRSDLLIIYLKYIHFF